MAAAQLKGIPISSVTLSASLGRGCSAASSPGRASSVASATAPGGAASCRFPSERGRNVLACRLWQGAGAVCRHRNITRHTASIHCARPSAASRPCHCAAASAAERQLRFKTSTSRTCEIPDGTNLTRNAGLRCTCMAISVRHTLQVCAAVRAPADGW